ncbi:MAG: stilbene synthase [Verrucomicrobiae bacterium]|nr:stilbene synthase [Verrucomicrobiae bacterium]
MFLNGFGTAVPGHRYRQSDCWAALQGTPDLDRLAPRSQALLRKVLLGANGIETRHLALNSLAEAFRLDPDTLHERFLRHAPDLATTAARRALEDARISAEDVDALLVATCTGYLCPGLTSHVSERLGLRNSVEFLDLVGLGCGAAIPTLRTAANWLAGGTTRTVLSVCVEVSSAAMYLDDDPGVLISACLFGDGAAAVVSAARPVDHRRRVQWRHAASRLHPEARSALCFEPRGGCLRNILTPAVPSLAATHVGHLADSMFHQAGIHQLDIREWILHPGGRDVLVALRDRLGLEEASLRHSAAVLRDFGNLSSPCVLFALRDALANGAPGGWWWLSSFGAGFSCHGALLEVS